MELKKAEITDKVKESVEQNGQKPELFGDIVKAAILLLELLIAKTVQKVLYIAEKVIGNGVSAVKETSKEMNSHIHVGDNPALPLERKKIPFPVNPHRKQDMIKNAEHPVSAPTEKESIIKQIKAEQKTVSIETEQPAERPPQPKPSVFARKYPRLKEIEGRLKDQNRAIFGREKKRDNQNYEVACVEYEKTYGEKVVDTRSVRNRLRQKEQAIKIRETSRTHQVKQKDKEAR